MGFVMTVLGAVCFGLMLSLIELIHIKAKKAVSYTMVLEIQMIIGVSATVFCTIGMIVNNDFQVSLSFFSSNILLFIFCHKFLTFKICKF